MFVKVNSQTPNLAKAQKAWGDDLPEWVAALATACDRATQAAVGDQLGRSAGYVSRIINRNYAGSYEEAEQLVRSRLQGSRVKCPVWDSEIQLTACIRYRRHKGAPRNQMQRMYAASCPTCPNNTDTGEGQS